MILSALLSLCGCPFVQYIAHYAVEQGFTTRINIQNPHSADVFVEIFVYDNDGVLMAIGEVVVPARGFFQDYIQSIPGLESLPGTGSIRIVAEEPGFTQKVSSIILFDYAGGPALGGLQSFSQPQKVLHFPWFQNTADSATGIAVLNVNDWPIQVVLRASASDGTIYDSDTQTLAPMQRIIGYPDDFFPPGKSIPENANLSVHAGGNVAGFIILHNNELTRIEAINGVPQVPHRTEFIVEAPVGVTNLNGNATDTIFSPDGNFIYIRTQLDYNVLVIDRNADSKGQIIQTIPFLGAGGMALSADAKYLYVGDVVEDRVYGISTTTFDKELYREFTNPWHAACSNDGELLMLASHDEVALDYLNAVQAPFGVTVALPDNADIRGGICTGDSNYFLVLDTANDMLYAIDPGGSLESYAMGGATTAESLAQQPDNRDIYIGHRGNEITVMAYPGFYYVATFQPDDAYFMDLAFSPDGRFLYAPSYGSQMLYVFDLLKSGDSLFTYPLAAPTMSIGCAPEGRVIYFSEDSYPEYPLKMIY